MSDKTVLDRVTRVTGRILGLDPSEIEPGAHFVFDLGAESVQSLELVAAFEEEFGIDMNQEEALAVQTVESAADYIGRCVMR